MQPDQTAEIRRVFELQRQRKWMLKRSSAEERKSRLQRLKETVVANAAAIRQALYDDLRKPEAEARGEIGSVEAGVNDALAHLDDWMKPVKIEPAACPEQMRRRAQDARPGRCWALNCRGFDG